MSAQNVALSGDVNNWTTQMVNGAPFLNCKRIQGDNVGTEANVAQLGPTLTLTVIPAGIAAILGLQLDANSKIVIT